MSVQVARSSAERLIERLQVRVPPVDVEAVAEALDLKIVKGDLGDNVSGLLVSRDGSASIAVQKNHHPHRQRFTIAHEIGHFVLQHHLTRNELVHTDGEAAIIYRSARASPGLDPIEVQANQFAASLLMPGRLLRERVGRLPKPLSDDGVHELALEFLVSDQAMTIRLTTLGLL